MSELKWKIRLVNGDVERYMPLLLEADPSRELVERYLAQGELWACEDDSGPGRGGANEPVYSRGFARAGVGACAGRAHKAPLRGPIQRVASGHGGWV